MSGARPSTVYASGTPLEGGGRSYVRKPPARTYHQMPTLPLRLRVPNTACTSAAKDEGASGRSWEKAPTFNDPNALSTDDLQAQHNEEHSLPRGQEGIDGTRSMDPNMIHQSIPEQRKLQTQGGMQVTIDGNHPPHMRAISGDARGATPQNLEAQRGIQFMAHGNDPYHFQAIPRPAYETQWGPTPLMQPSSYSTHSPIPPQFPAHQYIPYSGPLGHQALYSTPGNTAVANTTQAPTSASRRKPGSQASRHLTKKAINSANGGDWQSYWNVSGLPPPKHPR